MNKIIITGHVVKDIEIFNDKVGKFSVGVQRQFKNQNGEYDTDFLNCVVFNATDYVKQNLTKGTKVLVDGSIQTSVYDDKKGNKHYSTDIIVNRIEILKKSENISQKANKPPINPYQDFSEKVESDIGQQIQITEDDLQIGRAHV